MPMVLTLCTDWGTALRPAWKERLEPILGVMQGPALHVIQRRTWELTRVQLPQFSGGFEFLLQAG